MPGTSNVVVVAGGNEQGDRSDQLNAVSSVVVDKNGTMFICDYQNRRVQQWFKDDNQGQTIISDINCFGLAMDNEGSLYISDLDRYRVIKWPSGQTVAGKNGQGTALNQLESPWHIFVDQNQTVFVADILSGRVVKWPLGAKEGILVAGGSEDPMDQVQSPSSVFVDKMGTVYILEYGDRGVIRWFKGIGNGSIIIGGLVDGMEVAHYDLALDRHGNLYVADGGGDRIQMFAIDKSSCSTCGFYK
ncbi:unnamed protein product [Rotaria sp. Silwood2]|nr:unnamed protein product [Rotaria sp. Silwood2]CAF3380940.1 unnamed protein product [Rotaria sp. Silwood2]CAF4539726.1 unnamed protein product [Rotaria sp. Silwood2]CAF4549658.1 unnamed protein product [Rotaria sp. Silwood2]